ncbi:hypothetical protein SAQ01S_08720 [Sphingomonas aquatilis NBRC 16722]|uniref:Uncharacterized protein n=1 Tax=Sphingomonas aquatilis TaxID=93063 RepID=A0AAW3TQ70_9SPHN|nr:hypothetical protein [Sphingomonas aquatilis]GEM71106.1 hypothetical protein SAQ01S_08720 [Sphingomonas aquatilis NBRC 16722]
MLATSARARTPNKRKGRTVAVQPLQKLQHLSDCTDTIPPLQLQCLARYGVTGAQAAMLAPLIWGADGGNALFGGVA